MATNKRKEAAALFELIDKSTLKVPKNAGSLKIPSWWTSKNNPIAPGANSASSAPPAQIPASQSPTNGHATRTRPAPAVPSAPAPEARIAPAPAAAPPSPEPAAPPDPQSRLFEPPPASSSAPPPSSPSIRPPAPSVAPRVSHAPVNGSAPATAAPPRAEAPPRSDEPVAGSDSAPSEESSSAPRVFAPQTHAQSRNRTAWSPPRAGSFARMPPWILLTGVAGIVVVVCCLVILLKPRPKPAQADANPASSPPRFISPPQQQGASQTSLIPPMSPAPSGAGPAARAPANPPPVSNTNLADLPPPDYTSETGGGHWWHAGKIQNRTSDLLYIVILSTPSEDIARRNATFLADHGIDLSIEKRFPSGKLMYTLVSAEGYPTNAAAEAPRSKIVAIGHLLPEYKTKKRAWDDAYVVRVVPKTSG